MHVFLLWINLGLQSLITCPVSDIFPGVHFCLAVTVLLICVGSGRAFLNRNPECLGTDEAEAFCEHFCLSTLNTLQTPYFRHTSRKALMQDASSAAPANCELLPPAVPWGTQRLNTDTLEVLSLTLWERVNFTGLMKPGSWQKTQEGGWTLVSPYYN